MHNTPWGRRRVPRLVSLLATTTAAALLCTASPPIASASAAATTAPTAKTTTKPATAAATKPAAVSKAAPAKTSSMAKSPYTAAQLAMRSSMASASASAKKTKKPVAVAAATTMYSTVMANANGSFTFDENLAPQRVKQNNAWVPISATLVAGTGSATGTFHTKATVATITVSGGGIGPLITEDDGSGHVVTTTWPLGALPKPKVSGSTATYPGVLPGVDLQLQASALGVEDVLVVHNAAAAANPALATLKLGVSGTGLTVSSTAAGGIQAADGKGHVFFTGPTPMMWDSAGAPTAAASSAAGTFGAAANGPSAAAHTAAMPVTVANGTASMTPSRKLMTAASTVWPMFLDPQINDSQPENRTELWQCSAEANTSFFNAQNEGASNLNVNRVGWHPCGGDIRSLFQFDTSTLYTSGNSPNGNGAIAIQDASIDLTTQYQCTPVDVWRTGPFNSATTWNDQNASGQAIWSGASVLGTTGCNGNGAGQSWSINDYQQLNDAMVNGWTNVTIGLRAHNESLQNSTTNYMAFYAVNSGSQNARLVVNFYEDPTVTGFGVSSAPIGNQGAQVGVCGNSSAPAYLPMTSTPPQMTVSVNDNLTGVTAHTLGVEGMYYTGNTSWTWYGSDQLFTPDSSGNATVTVPMPTNLVDGQTYTVAPDVWDQTVYGGTTLSIFPNSCTVKIASTPPNQPTFGAGTFQAIGQHLSSYHPVGTGGSITVSATAPTTPIARFDWILNGPSTSEGAGKCGGIAGAVCGSITSGTAGTTGLGSTSASGPIAIASGAGNGEHWGDNYIYVAAVDAAGNISQFNRYDYFLSQPFQPVSFGNITGDGTPNLLGVDNNGNLIAYPANLDPAGSVNAVQVAPASAAPNGNSWTHALFTHRGAERVQPTDDLFGWDTGSDGNGHLYYYLNSQQASASTQPGYVPPAPAPLNAFTQTQKITVTRPACTASVLNDNCFGYDPTWNSVQQIVALGPVNGGCTITAPTTACKTNLITVESSQGGPSRVWMFSAAGVGQLRNPVLLSVSQPYLSPSQPGWDWSTVHLMAPGNAANHPGGSGGLPDLWAEDSTGTLWQFTNHSDTGTTGAGLGDIANKTQLGATSQFFGYSWINTVGDLNGDGHPDLWIKPTNGQINVLFGPLTGSLNPSTQTQTTATAPGWNNTAGISNLQGLQLTNNISGQVMSGVTGGATGQRCLDDLNGNLSNNAIADIYDCNGTFAQQWTFAADGTIHSMGTNPASPPNLCLDSGGSLVSGSLIELFTCDPTNRGAYQTWHLIPSPSKPGSYWIYNPSAGMCIDDPNASTANATQFRLLACNDSPAQLFTLPPGPGMAQTVEAENLGAPWDSTNGPATQTQGNCCGISLSNGYQLYFPATAAGQSVTLKYYVANAGTYNITPALTRTNDRGQVTVAIDAGTAQAVTLPITYDAYQATGVSIATVHFGTATLSAGPHTFTFTATGTNTSSIGNRYVMGIDDLALIPTKTTGPNVVLNVSNAGIVNLPVTADASSSFLGTAPITGYSFDFGDGTTTGKLTTPSATHAYSATGTYLVTVTATDSNNVSSTTSSPITVTAGATGQWKLNDGSGTTAADTGSPGGNPATATGSAKLTASGYAQFDGATGEDLATTSPVVDTSKSFTVSAWAKLNDLNNYYPVATQAGNTSFGFWLGYDHNLNSWALTTIQADANETAWYSAAGSPGSAQIGVWTHLVGTYDASTGRLSLYVNGVLQSRQDVWPTPFTAPGPFLIGNAKNSGALAAAFNGTIADVSVYPLALNAAEAASLYRNSGFTPSVNLAGGASVTASSYTSGWEPSHLTDGVLRGNSTHLAWASTLDSSANATEWAQIDLGAARSINEIDLWPRDDTGTVYCFPTAFTIATSTDGTTWTTQVSKTGYPSPPDSAQIFPIAPTTARYIKVTGTSQSADNFNNYFMELQQVTVMGQNLAAGATATASSYTAGWEPYHLTDGNYRGTTAQPGYASAFDSGANATEWAQVDLGTTHNLTEVDLFPRDEASNTIGSCFPVNFTVTLSTDETNWTTVVTENGYAKPGDSPQQFTFNQVNARYIKVTATALSPDPNGNYYFELRQIAAFGN